MDWSRLDRDLYNSFQKDFTCMGWADTGQPVLCRRSQEWGHGRDRFFIAQYDSARDIYLDHPFIAKVWREIYGPPLLRDFVKPATRREIEKLENVVSVRELQPWRVYMGKPECQYMYAKILEILDVCMRLVNGLYPRGVNSRSVWGDAGCWPGGHCSGHDKAHNSCRVLDRNYFTLEGFNMTQYRHRQPDTPPEYFGPNIKIWNDEFPYRNLNLERFDSEKNYATFDLQDRIFQGNSTRLLSSTGIENHFRSKYERAIVQGDDIKAHKHYFHSHEEYDTNGINFEALL